MFRQTLCAFSIWIGAAACGGPAPATAPAAPSRPPVAANELRAPDAFGAITDRAERSRALFLEATRVMLHARCANCHPSGDSPLQGDRGDVHDPPVQRGPEDQGVVGMTCSSCHQDRNLELARVPGAPKWRVARREMAWVGRTPHALCEQVKDPARNGKRTLAQIVDHSAHDELVGWGWHPGAGRTPAPGTQDGFGRLMQAWVDTGAECPRETGETREEAKR